jgi:hypothetical protein
MELYMNMFNNQGQMNAGSMKELISQLAKYASILDDNTPSNAGFAGQPSLSDEKRDDLISRAIQTSDGKIALAQAMASPIRKNLDYHGIARRALVVDPIAQGAMATYERDIDVAAVVISSNGTGPESRVFGDRVVVPEFEIFANPTVRIAEVKRRRFNLIDRAVQKARQEIMAQEDANVFAALDAAASVENTLTDIADAGLLKRDLVDIKQQIDGWDLVTTKFFMNIKEFTDILKWGSGGGQGPQGGDFDPVTMREVLQTGLYAHIWGADVMVSKIVPQGTVYGCADPEFVGVMPIRQDIEVIPADEPKQLKLGWVVSEIIGIAIVNPRGVAAGRKSVVIGA